MTEHQSTSTVPETAKRLRVGTTAIYGAIQRGEIPVIRIGKLIRVPTAWIDKTIAGEQF